MTIFRQDFRGSRIRQRPGRFARQTLDGASRAIKDCELASIVLGEQLRSSDSLRCSASANHARLPSPFVSSSPAGFIFFAESPGRRLAKATDRMAAHGHSTPLTDRRQACLSGFA